VVLVILVGFSVKMSCSFTVGLWQAIAQISSAEEVQKVLEEVTSASDAQVVRVIRDKGLERMKMVLGTDQGAGAVRLVRRR